MKLLSFVPCYSRFQHWTLIAARYSKQDKIYSSTGMDAVHMLPRDFLHFHGIHGAEGGGGTAVNQHSAEMDKQIGAALPLHDREFNTTHMLCKLRYELSCCDISL